MQIIINKAKRCSVCSRIVSVSAEQCPYCCGKDFSLTKSNLLSARPVFEAQHKPITKEAKKKMLIAAASVVGLGILIYIISFIADSMKINRSINEPLDMEYAYKQNDKMPGFSSMCQSLNDNRYSNSYPEAVTYKILYDYLSSYYDNDAYRKEQADIANFSYEKECRGLYIDKVSQELLKWDVYQKEHDVSRYLKLKVNTGYATEYSRYGTEYHPKWYYTVSMPQGAIKNCSVYESCSYDNSGRYLSLSDLKQLDGNRYTYYPRLDNSNFWHYYSVSFTIQSVTLTNGTVIRKGDERNVPYEYTNYFSDPSLRNEELIIINHFDSNYKSKSDYIRQKVEDNLQSLDPDCYNVATQYFNRYIETYMYYSDYNSLL